MRGPAVDLSTRLSELASDREVLASRTVRDLVAGSGLAFDPRGSRQLLNDGTEWEVFAAGVADQLPG